MYHKLAVQSFHGGLKLEAVVHRASNPAASSAFIGLFTVRSGSEVNALHHALALSLSLLLSILPRSLCLPVSQWQSTFRLPGFSAEVCGCSKNLGKRKRDTHGQNEAEESPTHSPLHCGRRQPPPPPALALEGKGSMPTHASST